jgi:hypothetical protein
MFNLLAALFRERRVCEQTTVDCETEEIEETSLSDL